MGFSAGFSGTQIAINQSTTAAGYNPSKEPATSEPDWDSSPDVAPDGSIVRNNHKDIAGGEARQDDGIGVMWTAIGFLLLPFYYLYYAVRYLISVTQRILTRPVPLVLTIASVALAAHLFGLIDLPLDAAASGVGGFLSAVGNASNTTATPADHTSSKQSSGIDRAKVELYVHEEINEERTSRGLSKLNWDDGLQEIARYHSKLMATDGFFSHTSPQGQTMADRYDMFGYSCRVQTSGNRYLTGAENIAQTYHHKNVMGQGRLTTNREVAEALVEQWMDSKGHRENILTADWNNEGIGVYITSENEVYATQNFC